MAPSSRHGRQPAATYGEVARALALAGLTARGAFHPAPEDAVPPLPDGGVAGTVILAGNAGPAMWAAFARRRPAGRDPLDAWSRALLTEIAARFGGHVAMPSDGPPYAPFQRWAMRAEPVHPSPLGILIHPDYGLWHGYRGALLFAAALPGLPPRGDRQSPCLACAGKPCLSACPVGAFSGRGYDVDACAGHLATPAGGDCMSLGCRARRACPEGRSWRYEAAQAEFHMHGFLRAR